jgi:hypothetical protein
MYNSYNFGKYFELKLHISKHLAIGRNEIRNKYMESIVEFASKNLYIVSLKYLFANMIDAVTLNINPNIVIAGSMAT